MKQIITIVALLAYCVYGHENAIQQTTPTPACPTCTYNIAPIAGLNDGANVNLTGVTVFITGGSRGIGRTTSLFYAKLGATVYSCARTPFHSVQNKTELRSAGIKYRRCDVRNEFSFSSIVDEFEANNVKIDLLISGAGIMFFGFPSDINTQQHRNLLRTNVEGFTTVWNNLRKFMNPQPAVVGLGNSTILLNATVVVITSSTADFLSPFLAHYSGSKIDLDRNAQVLAWSNKNKPLRFMNILPALTQTTILENSMMWEQTSSLACQDKAQLNFNNTVKRMADRGQPPIVVSQSILRKYLEMPWGTIGRFSASTPDGYAEYYFLSEINAKNQPSASTTQYQSLFAPGNADPVC